MEPAITIKKITSAFTDHRGSISDLIDEPIAHVGLIVTKGGVVRGNHYHKTTRQWVYILSGSVEWHGEDLREGQEKKKFSLTLSEGDFAIVPAMVAHAMKALTDCEMLEFASIARIGNQYSDDTLPHELIPRES